MAGIIDPRDFSELQQIEKNINTLTTAVKSMASQFKAFNQILEGSKTTQKQTSENIKQHTGNVKQLTDIEKEMLRIEKETAKVLVQKTTNQTQQAKNLERLRNERNEQNKQIREEIKLQRANNNSVKILRGSYTEIQKALNQNILKYKNLSAEQRRNSKEGRALEKDIKNQTRALKNMDARMGRFNRNVGNYTSSVRSLMMAFGITGGVVAFARVISGVAKKIKEFDKAQSSLAAVLGKTKKDIKDLAKDAKRYGGVTEFTAKQVSELQTELAKLGFAQGEIRQSTKGILDFASATGAELANAAKVGGSALRAFGMDASEMNRVVSVLAVATTKSALAFGDYETALSTVAPVARAFGFKIEDTIALLGKLKDSGFDATSAATATRNIILNLADANGNLAKRLGKSVNTFDDLVDGLKQLKVDGVDLNETLKLTDKRSVAAFNTFIEGADSAKKLRNSLIDVNDELDKMVETKLDNLAGDMIKLSSAWDQFIISLEDGQGSLAKASRGLIKYATNLVKGATVLAKGMDAALLAEFAEKNQKQAELRIQALIRATAAIDDQGVKLAALTDTQEAYSNSLNEAKQQVSEMEYLINNRKESTRAERKEMEKEVGIMKFGYIPTTEMFLELLQIEIDKTKELASQKTIQNKTIRESINLKKLEANMGESMAVSRGGFNIEVAILKQKKLLEQGEIDFEQYTQNIINLEIEHLQWRLQNIDWFTGERIRIETELVDKQIELQQLLIDKEREAHEEKIRLTQERLSNTQEIGSQVFDISSQFNEAANIQARNAYEEEIMRLEQKAEREMMLAGDNANAQRAIKNKLEKDKEYAEKRFDQEQRRIKRNQAITDKAAALFNAGVNVAVAITKTLANPVLSAFIAGLGAAQIAAITATPIPKFMHGTDAPLKEAITAVVGDGYVNEVIKTKEGGLFITPDRPTTMVLPKGSEVIPDIETAVQKEGNNKIEKLLQKQYELNNKIINRPVHEHNFTAWGYRNVVKTANGYTEYLDKYIEN